MSAFSFSNSYIRDTSLAPNQREANINSKCCWPNFGGAYNQVYEKTSFIITTNKKPADWAQMLNDEVLATALLDRLLFQCEVINLSGKSYRLENRKTIFDNELQPA